MKVKDQLPPVTSTVRVGASTFAVVSAESLGSLYSPETASKTRIGGKFALDVMFVVCLMTNDIRPVEPW